MVRKSVILLAVLLIVTRANADIVEYDLNCDGPYSLGQTWSADFDLGVTFSEISDIHLQWAGSIIAVKFEPIIPMPTFDPYYDGYFGANIYELNSGTPFANCFVHAGQETAPNPEPFDLQDKLKSRDYAPFLNGVGSFEVTFGQVYPPEWQMEMPIIALVSNASGQLNSAKLIFNGTVVPVPEPATCILLALGSLFLKRKK